MPVIKDKIFLGIVATVLGILPFAIIDYILYITGISKYHIVHIAASAYFPVSQITTFPALIVGGISHLTIFILLGIAIVYLLYFTGTDYFWVKGAGIFLISWLLVFGVTLRLNIGRIDPVDAGTNLTHLTLHILAGITVAWIGTKIGQKALIKT